MKPHKSDCVCAQCETDRVEARGFARGLKAAAEESASYPSKHAATLRDYFAAKALASILANEAALTRISLSRGDGTFDDAVATKAYHCADAMLTARNRERQP